MRDRLFIAALLVAAAVSGLFLAAPSRTGEVVRFAPESPGFPWGSPTTATAWGLLAALAVCVGARRVADALFVGAVAAVTLLVAAISTAPPTLLCAVTAGVLLGAAAQVGRARPGYAAPVATMTGVVAGILVAPMLAGLRAGLPTGNRRYADYIPSSRLLLVGDTSLVDVVACVLAVLAVAVLVIFRVRAWREQISGPPRAGVAGAAGIVVACALTQWWFVRFIASSLRDETSTGLNTFYGGYVVVGLTLLAALVHRGPGGLVWVGAAAATVAVATDGTSASGADVATVTALLVVVASVATTLVARRDAQWRRGRGVPIAIAVLTVFTAAQFLDGDLSTAIPALIGPFGVPVALTIALVVAAMATSPDQSAVVGAAALLTLLRVTTGGGFGWTSYTPLSDASGFDGLTAGPPSTAQTVVAVVALGSCLAVGVVLARRRVSPSVT